jgi:anaerobic magnesium-protoporphyrin IX monomethyl ester cyclase
MARISFIGVYDHASMGLRIMSKILNNAGHSCRIIFFKGAREEEIDKPSANPLGFEYMREWRLYSMSDSNFWTQNEEDLLIERLKSDRPDIIGYSSRSMYDTHSLPLLNRINKAFPDTILIAGGYGPSINPECYLTEVDYVGFGESEETILELANAFDDKKPIDEIQNLIFRRNGSLIRNPVRKRVKNIDQYPIPEFGTRNMCVIENDSLQAGKDPHPYHYTVIASRGCMNKCAYCSMGQWEKLYIEYAGDNQSCRRRSVNKIIEELKLVKSKSYKGIDFRDTYLTGPKAYLLELFARYGREIGLPFFANFNLQQIVDSPEIIDAAVEAGLMTVVIGVQHGDEMFCREYFHREVPNSTILRAAEVLRERKVNTWYHVLGGIPFETNESLDNSLKFFSKLPMEYGSVMPIRLLIYPHSPLIKKIKEKNLKEVADPMEWYYTGLLYSLRAVASDSVFDQIRSDKLFRKYPRLLAEVIQGEMEN